MKPRSISLDFAPPSLTRPISRIFTRILGADVLERARLSLRAPAAQSAGESASVSTSSSVVGAKSRLTRLVAIAGSALALLLGPWWESTARADTVIIQHPGDHARYTLELEPHLLFGFIDPPGYADGAGLGLGFRGSIPIVRNGFIPKLNNSVAIGFGVDIARYGRADFCVHYADNGECDDFRHADSFTEFWFPVVLQWNFFLSRNWSVFGEPGIALNYHAWQAPNAVDLQPLIMFVGGRYHFSEKITLTMRIGYPSFSVGCSFLL